MDAAEVRPRHLKVSIRPECVTRPPRRNPLISTSACREEGRNVPPRSFPNGSRGLRGRAPEQGVVKTHIAQGFDLVPPRFFEETKPTSHNLWELSKLQNSSVRILLRTGVNLLKKRTAEAVKKRAPGTAGPVHNSTLRGFAAPPPGSGATGPAGLPRSSRGRLKV